MKILDETRAGLLRWLKEHGVKMVIMGEGANEDEQWIVLQVHTAETIGTTSLYDREQRRKLWV